MTAELSQIDRDAVLEALFSSAARVTLLRVFLLDPLRAYYQRQIEAATGLAIRAVQRELERMTGIGLLFRRAEGNRTYYQVDMHFPLFPELRGIVLKMAEPENQLRGLLAMDDGVRLAFLCPADRRVLVVTAGTRRPAGGWPAGFSAEVMTSDEFLAALKERPEPLAPFLTQGVDLLGRRDDVIWRRIEALGYSVDKGKGVP